MLSLSKREQSRPCDRPSVQCRHCDVVLSELEARLPQSPFAKLRATLTFRTAATPVRTARSLVLRQAQDDIRILDEEARSLERGSSFFKAVAG
jgi:hypothetical protein